MTNERLHAETKALAEKHSELEVQLVTALILVQERQAYRDFKYKGLYTYCIKHLKMTESSAGIFRALVNTAIRIPRLKKALDDGGITPAYASRIMSSLTVQNADEVLEFAAQHSVRETDRWLMEEKGVIRQLKMNSNSETRELLRYAKSVCPGNLTDDQVLQRALKELIRLLDPLEKAIRAANRKAAHKKPATTKKTGFPDEQADSKSRSETNFANGSEPQQTVEAGQGGRIERTFRPPLTAQQKHAVNLRDQHRCTFKDRDGIRCGERRWLHQHHIQTVFEGGSNDTSNILSLCAEHHELVHEMGISGDEQRGWLRPANGRRQGGEGVRH